MLISNQDSRLSIITTMIAELLKRSERDLGEGVDCLSLSVQQIGTHAIDYQIQLQRKMKSRLYLYMKGKKEYHIICSCHNCRFVEYAKNDVHVVSA